LQEYADSISLKGAPLSTCIAFIDGTTKRITRPSAFQRGLFSGYKRFHALKFQSIVTPDGIVLHFFGPVEGRRHDLTLMRESKLDDLFDDPRARGYHIYGDAAYPNRGYLISGYKGENLSPEEMQFNMLMSKCRESVEWGFKELAVNWAFLDFHKNLKVFLSPVGKLFTVGALLTNFLTCLRRGNQISEYFNMQPPSIEEYIGNH
jgi:hypothetical protein